MDLPTHIYNLWIRVVNGGLIVNLDFEIILFLNFIQLWEPEIACPCLICQFNCVKVNDNDFSEGNDDWQCLFFSCNHTRMMTIIFEMWKVDIHPATYEMCFEKLFSQMVSQLRQRHFKDIKICMTMDRFKYPSTVHIQKHIHMIYVCFTPTSGSVICCDVV